MEKKSIDKLISWLIFLVLFILGILYQFSFIAMHYIYGWIAYVLVLISLIISLKFKIILKKRVKCLIASVIVLLSAIIMHFNLINKPYSYQYQKIDDGVKITKCVYRINNNYTRENMGEIVIPNEFMGKKVKAIGERAFSINQYISSLVLPDTIEVIEEYAFYGNYIPKLTLPNNIKVIEKSAFGECNIEELYLPDSLEVIGERTFGFADYKMTYVNVPKNVKSIGPDAFEYANITAFECMENDVEYSYDGNSRVYFESIAYEYENVVYVLHNDKTATVGKINYLESNITLFDKINYNNNEYLVTTIEEKAGFNSKLSEIVIPNTVTTIKNSAFAHNENLIKIDIPNSVLVIGEKVFDESYNVNIYVEHSQKPEGWHENWNSDGKVFWDCNLN